MDRVWKSLWIKLVAANLWLVWSNFKSNPLWCVFGVKQFAQRHLWVLPAGIHRNHFHLINFSFLFGHTFSIEHSMLPSDSAWAPSSFGRPSDTLSGLTACLPLGATQHSPAPKGLAITANGARLYRHCGGNDHVLTIGFQRKRHRVGKGGWRRRGGEWKQYAERSGNNMYLWKKN